MLHRFHFQLMIKRLKLKKLLHIFIFSLLGSEKQARGQNVIWKLEPHVDVITDFFDTGWKHSEMFCFLQPLDACSAQPDLKRKILERVLIGSKYDASQHSAFIHAVLNKSIIKSSSWGSCKLNQLNIKIKFGPIFLLFIVRLKHK